MNTTRILAVVDAPAELERYRSLFGQLQAACNVVFTRSESDGLRSLSVDEFDLLFVDLVAGPQTSARFLTDFADAYPRMIRVIIGPALDAEVLVACLVGSHQFLLRPYETEELVAMVDRVNLIHGFLHSERLRSLISRIRTFPSRPTTYFEVMRELRSENCSVETVGKLIEKDSFVATKFLQLINSASFGFTGHVTSPADAVLFLGMETTASLILAIEALASHEKGKRLRIDLARLWRHSQSVADLARRITAKITGDMSLANAAFTGGLLHDIGKIALAMNVSDDYNIAVRIAQETCRPEFEVEHEILGTTHAEVGAYLLGMWGLPAPLLEAVATHHHAKSALKVTFSAQTAVHLADLLVQGDFCSINEALSGYPAPLNLLENEKLFSESIRPLSRAVSSTDVRHPYGATPFC